MITSSRVDYRNLEELRSDRLILNRVSERDVDDLFLHFTPTLARYMVPQPGERQSTIEFVRSATERFIRDRVDYVVRDHSNQFVGSGALSSLRAPFPEVGLWVREDSQGKGYGMEIASCLVTAVRGLAHSQGVDYPVHADNLPSRALAEKLSGSIHSAITRRRADGSEVPLLLYRIPKN